MGIRLYLPPASMTIPGVGLVYMDPLKTAGSGYRHLRNLRKSKEEE